jgi:hypothetical protein
LAFLAHKKSLTVPLGSGMIVSRIWDTGGNHPGSAALTIYRRRTYLTVINKPYCKGIVTHRILYGTHRNLRPLLSLNIPILHTTIFALLFFCHLKESVQKGYDVFPIGILPSNNTFQITVSLLMSVRDLLLVYDYTDAVSLLMKLPSNISVSYIVSFALHLKG